MKNKSITIHGINKELDDKIKEKSNMYKTSQNKTVKKILEDALFVKDKNNRVEEFADIFGAWNEEDANEFMNNIKDMDKIDPKDWT